MLCSKIQKIRHPHLMDLAYHTRVRSAIVLEAFAFIWNRSLGTLPCCGPMIYYSSFDSNDMADLTFDCPDCEEGIQPAQVLGALASQGITEEVISGDAELNMDCPQCNERITFETAEIVVKLAADDATLAVMQALEKADTTASSDWEPDFEQVIENERQARERRKQLEEKLEDIRESL